MKVDLVKEDCYCGLEKFYENVAKKMGVVVTDNTLFDCTKLCVTSGVQNELWAYYYTEEGWSNPQIAALFLCMGPKASLGCPELYFAEVKEGFVSPKVEIDDGRN